MTQLLHYLLRLLVLVDVRQQVPGYVLELLHRHIPELLRQTADCLREQVVDVVSTFSMQFMEEKLNLVLNLFVRVLQQHANVNYLSLKLEHVVQDQVCDNHKCLPSHMIAPIMQQVKHVPGAFMQGVWETVEQITQ